MVAGGVSRQTAWMGLKGCRGKCDKYHQSLSLCHYCQPPTPLPHRITQIFVTPTLQSTTIYCRWSTHSEQSCSTECHQVTVHLVALVLFCSTPGLHSAPKAYCRVSQQGWSCRVTRDTFQNHLNPDCCTITSSTEQQIAPIIITNLLWIRGSSSDGDDIFGPGTRYLESRIPAKLSNSENFSYLWIVHVPTRLISQKLISWELPTIDCGWRLILGGIASEEAVRQEAEKTPSTDTGNTMQIPQPIPFADEEPLARIATKNTTNF